MNVTLKQTLFRLVAFLAGALVVGSAIVARGEVIRLHDQAAAGAGDVTLAQVAELDEQTAWLGDTVVAELRESQPFVGVSLESVRRALDERGVNWADVTLAGFAACRVTRLSEPVVEPAPAAEPAAASNPREEVNLTSTMTLRDLLVQKIEQIAGAPRAELRIAFDERDTDKLNRAAFGQRYEVVPHKPRGLGRVILRVRRYEMDRAVEQLSVSVDVTKRALAAVTVRDVERGRPFLPDDFEVREVYLDDAATQPIADPKLLLSQTAFRTLHQGAVITPDDLRSATMVRRGELVNVRCVSGSLVVRLDARAMEDGALDQVIRLRNERSREDFAATVTGLRQAAFTVPSTQAAAP